MLNMLLNENTEGIRKILPDYYATHVLEGPLDRFECHRDVNLISFDWYDVRNPLEKPSRVVIYTDAQDHLVLFETRRRWRRLAHSCGRLLRRRGGNEQALYRFFIGLVKCDNDSLEALEEKIISAEDGILTRRSESSRHVFTRFRRELFVLKRYYEQLNTIFEGLVENENRLIGDESLRHFVILDGRIDRAVRERAHLRDYLSQVREAYQAQIDIEQNSLMKTFTVITAVFLPLTLLVAGTA